MYTEMFHSLRCSPARVPSSSSLGPLAATRIPSDPLQHLSPSEPLSSDHKAKERAYRAILCWHPTTTTTTTTLSPVSPYREPKVSLSFPMLKVPLLGGGCLRATYHHPLSSLSLRLSLFFLPPKDPRAN